MKTKTYLLLICLAVVVLSAKSMNVFASSESEVVLKTATGDLFGTQMVPEGTGTFPVVLIIPGSGPTDRDGNSAMGLQTNAYKLLAEDLAKNNIASLRIDKRGIGKSQSAMTSESDLRFETYIDDVANWISSLKDNPRFSKIILLGHSEGSLIGIVAAEKIPVDVFISVSGPGRPADQILQEQLRGKLPLQLQSEAGTIIDSLKAGKTVANVSPSLKALFRSSVQPYLISHMKYDPVVEIAKLKIPVLIVQGNTDLQVPTADAELLAKASPGAKLLLVENMNHVLKDAPDDIQTNLGTYRNGNLPLKEGLVKGIVEFLNGK